MGLSPAPRGPFLSTFIPVKSSQMLYLLVYWERTGMVWNLRICSVTCCKETDLGCARNALRTRPRTAANFSTGITTL